MCYMIGSSCYPTYRNRIEKISVVENHFTQFLVFQQRILRHQSLHAGVIDSGFYSKDV